MTIAVLINDLGGNAHHVNSLDQAEEQPGVTHALTQYGASITLKPDGSIAYDPTTSDVPKGLPEGTVTMDYRATAPAAGPQ